MPFVPLDPKRVLKPTRKLRKLLKNMPKQPAPQQVHDLRTNTRRFEAILAAVSPEAVQKEKNLLKDPAAIRKKAGKVRDMDVLTDYAAGLEADGKDNCRVWLIEHLGAERKNDAKKLHRAITSHANSVRSGLKSASARLEKILCANGDKKTCDPIEAMAQATASALKLESKLFDPAHLSRNNLHPYRLKVKELHNVLRTGVNSTHHEFVETLNSVKDSIGEWHDWEELLATAKKELDHANCKLIRELKSTADRKYAEALAQTESMRKKYLQIDRDRRSLRKKRRSRTCMDGHRSMAA